MTIRKETALRIHICKQHKRRVSNLGERRIEWSELMQTGRDEGKTRERKMRDDGHLRTRKLMQTVITVLIFSRRVSDLNSLSFSTWRGPTRPFCDLSNRFAHARATRLTISSTTCTGHRKRHEAPSRKEARIDWNQTHAAMVAGGTGRNAPLRSYVNSPPANRSPIRRRGACIPGPATWRERTFGGQGSHAF